MVDLIALAIYLVALSALTWSYSKKVGRLGRQVEQQHHLITGLGIALVKHLAGEDVQVEIIPLRTDEKE